MPYKRGELSSLAGKGFLCHSCKAGLDCHPFHLSFFSFPLASLSSLLPTRSSQQFHILSPSPLPLFGIRWRLFSFLWILSSSYLLTFPGFRHSRLQLPTRRPRPAIVPSFTSIESLRLVLLALLLYLHSLHHLSRPDHDTFTSYWQLSAVREKRRQRDPYRTDLESSGYPTSNNSSKVVTSSRIMPQGPTEFKRHFVPRKLLFYFIFHGFHIGIFALGW